MSRPKTPRGAGTDTGFERAYRAGLAQHLEDPDHAETASRLGKRASRLGLETLALARMHDRALESPALRARVSDTRKSTISSRERAFFRALLAPVEEATPVIAKARKQAERLTAQLERSKQALSVARERVARGKQQHTLKRKELADLRRELRDCERRGGLVQERLRRMSHKILTVQETERRRISRDLHDALGQALTGINVGLAELQRESTAGARELARAVELTQQLVTQSMQAVHRFCWELRPTLLDDLGLVPALRSYTRDFAKRTGIKLAFDAKEEFQPLDDDRRTALFRVAQGALSNVERHARAKQVRVSLRRMAHGLRLEVRDDGRSFDTKRMDRSKTDSHLGLLVMRERTEMVGGHFTIHAGTNGGTVVHAVVPLETADRE